jgi:hypothetical protein
MVSRSPKHSTLRCAPRPIDLTSRAGGRRSSGERIVTTGRSRSRRGCYHPASLGGSDLQPAVRTAGVGCRHARRFAPRAVKPRETHMFRPTVDLSSSRGCSRRVFLERALTSAAGAYASVWLETISSRSSTRKSGRLWTVQCRSSLSLALDPRRDPARQLGQNGDSGRGLFLPCGKHGGHTRTLPAGNVVEVATGREHRHGDPHRSQAESRTGSSSSSQHLQRRGRRIDTDDTGAPAEGG